MDPQEVAPILGLTANGVAALSSRAVRCYGKHGCRLIFPTQNRWASAVGCSAASATTRGTVSPSGTIGVWLPTWKAARSAVSCRRRWRRSAPSSRWSSCLLRCGRRRGGARQWPGWRGPARRGIGGSGMTDAAGVLVHNIASPLNTVIPSLPLHPRPVPEHSAPGGVVGAASSLDLGGTGIPGATVSVQAGDRLRGDRGHPKPYGRRVPGPSMLLRCRTLWPG